MAAPIEMCNSSSTSDSSSSDDENLAKITEAVVEYPTLTASGTVENTTKKKSLTKNHNLPSLRPSEKTHEDENALNTTPEFRAHVAKKLSTIIDSSVKLIEKVISQDHQRKPPEDDDLDFKLFTTSVPGKAKIEHSTKRRRPPSSSSSDSSDEERFESCAVSADFILAQSKITIACEGNTSNTTEARESVNKTPSDSATQDGNSPKKKRKKNKQKDRQISNSNSDSSAAAEVTNPVKRKKHKKKSKHNNESS